MQISAVNLSEKVTVNLKINLKCLVK